MLAGLPGCTQSFSDETEMSTDEIKQKIIERIIDQSKGDNGFGPIVDVRMNAASLNQFSGIAKSANGETYSVKAAKVDRQLQYEVRSEEGSFRDSFSVEATPKSFRERHRLLVLMFWAGSALMFGVLGIRQLAGISALSRRWSSGSSKYVSRAFGIVYLCAAALEVCNFVRDLMVT
jgi:hypothetical protein